MLFASNIDSSIDKIKMSRLCAVFAVLAVTFPSPTFAQPARSDSGPSVVGIVLACMFPLFSLTACITLYVCQRRRKAAEAADRLSRAKTETDLSALAKSDRKPRKLAELADDDVRVSRTASAVAGDANDAKADANDAKANANDAKADANDAKADANDGSESSKAMEEP